VATNSSPRKETDAPLAYHFWSVGAHARLTGMNAAGSQAENGEILLGSTGVEQYLPAVQMAELLQLSDNELSRLARSAVLTRQRDPCDSRAYVYPAWANIRNYILHVRARKEGAHTRWLEEKNKTARLERLRAQLELRIKEGRLVDKEELFRELEPRMLKIRKALEEALRVGVPRSTIDRISSIMTEANEGLEEGPEPRGGQER